MHDNDENRELTWINHRWTCDGYGRDDFYLHNYGGHGAVLLGFRRKEKGAWCPSWDPSNKYRFICESSE